MPLTVVVGGQYGSEGKGKLVSHLCRWRGVSYAVRTGGPNAGHTTFFNGVKHISRVLPSGYTNPDTKLVIGAGGMVDVPLLLEEIEQLEDKGYRIRDRLFVDYKAAVVSECGVDAEKTRGLGDRIGSTQTGTGWTQVCRILRDPNQMSLAGGNEYLEPWVCDATELLNGSINRGEGVVVEGTQGFGLSLYHGVGWPYCTSRDTSAAGFVSEAGLSPRLVDEIYLVFRTWPIRVGGNSGPMYGEVTWRDVHEFRGFPSEEVEMTSVTKKVRRVGRFDWKLAEEAVMVNRPTALAIHGLDYVNYHDSGVTSVQHLSKESLDWVADVEDGLDVRVKFLFTGPRDEDMCWINC
jgi:adenylosuccinate synthase